MKRILACVALIFCTGANADVSMGELANMAYADAMRGGNLTDAQHVVYRYRVEIGRMVDEKKMPLESAIELLQRMEGKPLATVSQGEVLRQQAERDYQQRIAEEEARKARLRQGLQNMIDAKERAKPLNCTSTSLPGTGQINTTCR